jgi:hypothetical protein
MKAVLFLTFFSFYVKGYTQPVYGGNLSLKDIATDFSTKVKFDSYNPVAYDEVETCSDFDFYLFKPSTETNDKGNRVSIFKNEGVIKKISYRNERVKWKNFDVFFFHTDQFSYYTIFLHHEYSSLYQNSNFVKGVFVRFNANRYTYLFMIDNLEQISEINEITVGVDTLIHYTGNKLYRFNPNFDTKNIQSIIELDEQLKGCKTLRFDNGKLLAITKYDYYDENVIEMVSLISPLLCEEVVNIDSMTMDGCISTLDDIIRCQSHHWFKSYPINYDRPEIPLWVYGNE